VRDIRSLSLLKKDFLSQSAVATHIEFLFWSRFQEMAPSPLKVGFRFCAVSVRYIRFTLLFFLSVNHRERCFPPFFSPNEPNFIVFPLFLLPSPPFAKP